MKISQLIAKAKRILETEGDVEVVLPDGSPLTFGIMAEDVPLPARTYPSGAKPTPIKYDWDRT